MNGRWKSTHKKKKEWCGADDPMYNSGNYSCRKIKNDNKHKAITCKRKRQHTKLKYNGEFNHKHGREESQSTANGIDT